MQLEGKSYQAWQGGRAARRPGQKETRRLLKLFMPLGEETVAETQLGMWKMRGNKTEMGRYRKTEKKGQGGGGQQTYRGGGGGLSLKPDAKQGRESVKEPGYPAAPQGALCSSELACASLFHMPVVPSSALAPSPHL